MNKVIAEKISHFSSARRTLWGYELPGVRESRRNRRDKIKEWKKINKLKPKRSLEPAGIGNCSLG